MVSCVRKSPRALHQIRTGLLSRMNRRNPSTAVKCLVNTNHFIQIFYETISCSSVAHCLLYCESANYPDLSSSNWFKPNKTNNKCGHSPFLENTSYAYLTLIVELWCHVSNRVGMCLQYMFHTPLNAHRLILEHRLNKRWKLSFQSATRNPQ